MVDPSESREIYRDEDSARFQALKGAVWLRGNLGVKTSNFGARVAHLLDRLAPGIHNVSPRSLERAKWDDEHAIQITWYGSLATYDSNQLTRLVLLCHDLSIRAEIEPCGPNYLRLRFGRRIRNGSLYEGHPTLTRALIGYDPARFGGNRA